MRAARIYAPYDVRVDQIPEPAPGPGEIKVEIAYCGICGTDTDIYDGSFALMRAPWWPKPPFQFGHEASGVIAELGPGLLDDYQVGQRVAMNFRTYCGTCHYCRSGMEQMCEHVTSYESGFAEYALYGEGAVYPLPDSVGLEDGAMLEPVTIALHAVEQADVRPGGSVAICGAGTIGQLILQIVRRAGAARVLVSNPSATKREVAARCGADLTVDPLTEDLPAIGREFTAGRGFDTVFEASGTAAAVRQSLGLAGRRGTIVWVGVYPEQMRVEVDPYHMFANELTIRSSLLAPYTFPRALALLPELQLAPLISEIVPLEDIGRALDTRKASKAIKILVRP